MVRRAHRRIALNTVGAGAVVLVLVAGIFTGFRAFAGSPSQPAGQPTTAPPATSSPATHAHSPSPSPSRGPSSSPSPSSSASGVPARCAVGHLQIREYSSGGAAGSIRAEISMRNVGPASCSLQGYPGMALLAGSTQLHTVVVRGSSVVVPSIAVRAVTLARGQIASYVFGYSDVPTGSQTCPSSTGLEVTPPNDYGHATLSLEATACGGVLTTSPVFPGTRVPSS